LSLVNGNPDSDLDRVRLNRQFDIIRARARCKADTGKDWLCMFALDIYDWKDLGSHTNENARPRVRWDIPVGRPVSSRGATRDAATRIAIPNRDTLDAFGR
jgi:hypothetical protein